MLAGKELSLDIGRTSILSGVDVRFDVPEAVAVVGRSGAGKTSLLHCLAGLRPPTAGRVEFRGEDLYRMSERSRAAIRLEHFGFVFQRADLVAELTLEQNIALPLEMRGERASVTSSRVRELIDELGLSECAGRRPTQVSGGQRQRAAVARALAGRPSVVFADEPTGALDSENGAVVLELLLRSVAGVEALLVMVTHDRDLAERCDRVITMSDGRVVADARVRPC